MQSTTWSLDPSQSHVNFKVSHLLVSSIEGTFEDFEAEIETDEANDHAPRSITVTAQVDSIHVDNEKLNQFLTSPDFFNAAMHPTLVFRGTEVKHLGDNRYEVLGEATVKGKTRQVRLEAEYDGVQSDGMGGLSARFHVEGDFDRKDWDLELNAPMEVGGILVGDTVHLTADLAFTQEEESDMPQASLGGMAQSAGQAQGFGQSQGLERQGLGGQISPERQAVS